MITRADTSEDLRAVYREGGRDGDAFYRDRWSHDKVVPSTHGVNCTGSCRWNVYVKDGIITWESQDTDYPSVGPDRPEYEPRGCPRGASFSWYSYSPTRIRHPQARGVLVEMYREARQATGDPVAAWASIVDDPQRRSRYQRARGKGGLVRTGWDEAVEMIAAAHVHTLRRHAPTASPVSPRSRRCRWSRTRWTRGSCPCSARRCCRSTTGTPTCPWLRRRSSGTRPTCRSPRTGGTRRTC